MGVPKTLRAELEAWTTRNEPWTGQASMTAEDGYNAAIEEVVGMLNYHHDDVSLDVGLLARAIAAVSPEGTKYPDRLAFEYERLSRG